jgi:hypothetical protein
MIDSEFAETLDRANAAEMLADDLCCIKCGLIGGIVTATLIAICQHWQAIVSIFN